MLSFSYGLRAAIRLQMRYRFLLASAQPDLRMLDMQQHSCVPGLCRLMELYEFLSAFVAAKIAFFSVPINYQGLAFRKISVANGIFNQFCRNNFRPLLTVPYRGLTDRLHALVYLINYEGNNDI